MSVTQVVPGPRLPGGLRDQLLDFRRRVWSLKTLEASAVAWFGCVVSYLALFVLDRFADTPGSLRLGLLAAALAVSCVLPLYAYRWIWRRRRLPELARLLSRKHPLFGDQLLGIIELVDNPDEQGRSPALCEAAIRQVAREAAGRDFRDAVPNPRHRRWACAAAVPSFVALMLLALVPAAAANAWLRFLAPWRETPRYTFAALAPLAERLVVPHGEPFSLSLTLGEHSRWHPAQATARYGAQAPLAAALAGENYVLEVPAQIEPDWLSIRVGDWRQRVRVEPTLRPELVSVAAEVELPEYLGRPEKSEKDVRGGSLSVVKGSLVSVTASANRALAGAAVNEQPLAPRGADFVQRAARIDESTKLEFSWRDEDGLSGLKPFVLSIQGRDDEPPTVFCENLPRQKVVLDSEQLSFTLRAGDDFGVKQVGLVWEGLSEEEGPASDVDRGERLLSAGGRDREHLDAAGTFCAKSLGIEPQPVWVRMYVEDYLPGRQRVYSPPFTFYVLTPEQHALWLTEQLNKWQRQSLEVRDPEMQLYETNKELRERPADELDEPDVRRNIERQADAERANGRRLSGLAKAGEELIGQATRNPEFGVGHIEKWAEMLQVLKDISANRMPSVADLLKQAAAAPPGAAKKPSPVGPQVGQVRAARQGGSPPKADDKQAAKPPVPSIADVESTQRTNDPAKKSDDSPPSSGSGGLRLPTTALLGGVKPNPNASCPASQKVDEAVQQQEDLLAEFAKVADELNRILANLEGSTFVKRLKAASRGETRMAGKLNEFLSDNFGAVWRPASNDGSLSRNGLVERQMEITSKVDTIVDDMQAYYERRRLTSFRTVLDEMKQLDVVSKLRQISDELPTQTGLSIAQCEYWSDTLDRWAENLVDPASGGT